MPASQIQTTSRPGASLRRRVGDWAGPARRRRLAWLAPLALAVIAATACFQQSNTYPIEVFTEMHYSQAHRAQEPPRQDPVRGAVAFTSAGGPMAVMEVPAMRSRPYDPEVAGELYRVNCSVCHGMSGMGDGPAAKHITSTGSIYAKQNDGKPYAQPTNLIELRAERTPEVWFAVMNSGVNVMPRFGALLSEEDIRDVIAYLFDEETGVGTQGAR